MSFDQSLAGRGASLTRRQRVSLHFPIGFAALFGPMPIRPLTADRIGYELLTNLLILHKSSRNKVFTVEQIGQLLRVPEGAVRQEIESGRLRALNVAGHVRVREVDLNTYLERDDTKSVCVPGSCEAQTQNPSQLSPAADFTHTWPDGTVERYTEAHAGIASYLGREYRVQMGFTFRHSAGKRRRRSLVLVDRYPTVEFVAADEKTKGMMASIIRNRDGKQLPVGATLPPEYQVLPVGPYSEIVIEPGASNGVAVVCESRDFDTMIKHALIRYRFRKERR
ncbi:MAG: excisionase family DNA-binding protein [Bryobacteraceae bacterium]